MSRRTKIQSLLAIALIAVVTATWLSLRTTGSAPQANTTLNSIAASPAPQSSLGNPLPRAAIKDLDQAVAQAKKNFNSPATVATSHTTAGGVEERIEIIRVPFKYPLIRIVAKQESGKPEGPTSGGMVADHLIVHSAEGVSPAEFTARMTALGLTVRQQSRRPGAYLVGFPLVPDRTDDLERVRARLLEAEDIVALAEPDFLVTVSALPPGEVTLSGGQLWSLHNVGIFYGLSGADINAAPAWDTTHDAPDTIVAVIDSGIYFDHSDLAANLWSNPGEIAGNGVDDDSNGVIDDTHGFNAFAGNGNPDDDNGHGTHCAGIIAADGHNASGVTGVAWSARLMSLKFLSAEGAGVTSDAIECIDYAVDHGAKILNLSWGGSSYSASLLAALERARTAGAIVIAAAGNDARNNDNTPIYPAGYALDNILAVAATDRRDTLAWFSNYGPAHVHLAAPGAEILSTWIGGTSATKTLSGTSMAAPHVSGAAALLAARFPSDTYRQRINRILGGAETIVGLPVARSARLNLLGALTTASPSPVNDTFVNADTSSLNGVVWRGDNTHATTQPGEPAHVSGGPLHSVWYRWTAPVSGQTRLAFAPSFPGRAAIYTGATVSSLSPVSSTAGTSITFNATAGTAYHIAVDGNSGATGSFTLTLSIPPANDNKAAATVVTGESWSVSGSNLGSGIEPGETAHANVPGGRSVWWRWTAPLDGPVRIATDGSDFDTSLAVYDDAGAHAIIQGEQPDLVLVIDVSGSTADTVNGSYVGDTNADGRANTILDAEIAAAQAVRQTLIEIGKPARVSVVKFSDTAALLDMDPVTPGVQTSTTVAADLDTNGVPDVIQALRTLRAGGLTNYTDGLTKAGDAFTAMSTASGNGTLVFLSDGKPSDSGNFTAVANSLRASGHLLHAFGAGGGSSLASLQLITPQALIFTNIAELIAVFDGAVAANDDHSGLLTSQVNFSARAGHTYSIAVDGYKGATGTIQLAAQYSQAIEIVSQPRDTSVERFAPARLDVVVRGVAPFNYQWFHNDDLIPGETGSSLIIDHADIQNAGNYRVVVNNTFTSVASRTASLEVIVRSPAIAKDLLDQTVVAGSQVVLSVNALGTGPLLYQWFKDGAAIDGATGSQLVIASASASDVGAYKVVITNESGAVTSQTSFLSLAGSPFETWTRRQPAFTPHGLQGLVFLNNRFIAFGNSGMISVSIDGRNWKDATVPGAYFGKGDTTNVTFRKVIWLDGSYFALGDHTTNFITTYVLYRSLDGLTWEKLANPRKISDLSFIDGTYVGHGITDEGYQAYYRSEDLAEWTYIDRFGYEVLPIVGKGATWKYLTNVASYPANWTAPSFNDSSWSSGAAKFGYGDGNEVTTVAAGTTTLFRFSFPSTRTGNVRIIGEHLSDDGVLVSFNGAQILRSNLPTGTLNPWTPAVSSIEGLAETTYAGYRADATYALASTNTLAVEVHQSTDGTHDMGFDLSASAEFFYSSRGPAVGNGRMVVLRGDGKSFTSTDGVAWTMHSNNGLDNAAANQFYSADGIVFLNGQFMAWNKINKRLYRSTDGITWTLHTTNYQIESLTWDGQNYSFFNSTGTLFYSANGITWSFKSLTTGSNYVKPGFAAAGNGIVVIANSGGISAVINQITDVTADLLYLEKSHVRRLRILNDALVSLADSGVSSIDNYSCLSYDGAAWNRIAGPLTDLAYGNDTYLQFYNNGQPAYAFDLLGTAGSATQWTTRSSASTLGWSVKSQVYAGGLFVAVGPDGVIATSTDAAQWTTTRAAVTADPDLTWVDRVGNVFFALGRDGLLITSTDGTNWTKTTLSTLDDLTGVAFGNGLYVIGTDNATETEFFTSTNAVTWTRVVAGAFGGVRDVTFGGGNFAAVTGRRIAFSGNGSTWAATDLPGDEGRAIAFYRDTFVVVGDNNSVFQSGVIDTTPPALVLDGLVNGAVITSRNPVGVQITSGSGGTEIVSVDFILDGVLMQRTTVGPFLWNWDATEPGDHRLSVVARDAQGNASFGNVTFSVEFSPWQTVSPSPAIQFNQTATTPDGVLYGVGGQSSIGSTSVIARTRDGASWEVLDSPITDAILNRIVAGDNGALVATGTSNYVVSSATGEKWQRVNLPLGGLRLAWGNGLFLAMPSSNPSSCFLSANGVEWTQVNFGSAIFGANVSAIVYAKNRFVLATRDGKIFNSSNGTSWTLVTTTPLWTGNRTPTLTIGNGVIALLATDVFSSTDGVTWTQMTRPNGQIFTALSYGDGLFVGRSATALSSSTDLLSWTSLRTFSGETDPFYSATYAYGAGTWIAYVNSSLTPFYATSGDLSTWIVQLSVDTSVSQRTTERSLSGVASDGQQLLAVGSRGLLQRSTDGRTWIQQPYIGTDNFSALTYTAGKWVAAGANGAVYTSSDGSTWTKRTTGTTKLLNKILHNGSQFVILGDGVVLNSSDAETWNAITTVNSIPVLPLFDGIVTGGRFALLSNDRYLYSSTNGTTWQRADITVSPMTHGYHIVESGGYVYIRGGANSVIRSTDLVNWTTVAMPMPKLYTAAAAIGSTRLSLQNDGTGDFRFSIDSGASWFTMKGITGYGGVAAFKGSYYAVGLNQRVDEFSLIDLQPANLVTSTDESPGPGSPLHLEWDLTNSGYVDYDQQRAIPLEVRLSANRSVADGDDIILLSEIFSDTLSKDQTVHFTRNLALPPDITPANYYVAVIIDGKKILSELNEKNNVMITAAPAFEVKAWTLSVTQTPGGTVRTGSSAGVGSLSTVRQTASGYVTLGARTVLANRTTVDLVAVPDKGFGFTGWLEHPAQTFDSLSLEMTKDQSVTPLFSPVRTFTPTVHGQGSLAITPDDGIYMDGDLVQIVVTPAPGWRFVGWSGDLAGANAQTNFTVSQDSAATATFAPIGISVSSWRQTHFGDDSGNPLIAGDAVDPDSDGRPNLLEYALGTNPREFDQGGTTQLETRGGELVFTVMLDQQATDITALFESTTTLTNPLSWSGSGIVLETTAETATHKTIEARIPYTQGARFLRLRIQQNP